MQVENNKEMKSILLLEDGTFFLGSPVGFPKKVIGEVVFNTGMVGYNESITDPSYKGQILTFTYPLIGNYGVPSNLKDRWGIPIYFESDKIQVSAIVVSELCKNPSHPTSVKSLNDWLYEEGIPGIEGIDTRELTKKLREKGVLMGILDLYDDKPDIDELYAQLKKAARYDEINYSKELDLKKEIVYENEGPTIALIDCGSKYNILRNLLKRGFKVVRFPCNYSLDKVLSYDPKGVVISNGPGNPKKFEETIELVKGFVELNIPLLGICLGNQLVALACGGTTFKMKYGHRGQNKPSIFLGNGLTYVTSQNHGYAVDLDSLKDTGLKVWWINADDRTIEGYIMFNLNASDPFKVKEKWCYVSDIYVLPDYRKKGIGSMLLRAVEELAKKEGIKSIRLIVWRDNEEGIKFYKSLNFKEVGYLMEKDID